MGGRACISIDVDPIPCYYRIHSLGRAPDHMRSRILCRSLPRFAELFDRLSVKATFFIVAEDIDPARVGSHAGEMRAVLKDVASAGHEIASHSYSHLYEMARLGRDETREELRRAHSLLSELWEQELRGFRAPGYDVSPHMLEELEELGYLYDSSVFPAPAYYAAKAAVMGALAALGRPSGAVLTNPRLLAAPIEPYHPSVDRPWKKGLARLLEIPISVTAATRTPVIGTNLLMAPRWLRAHWLKAMKKQGWFNFELHGIDLCDAELDEMPAELVARQPDLRLSLPDKERALEKVILSLIDAEMQIMRLDEFAATHEPRG